MGRSGSTVQRVALILSAMASESMDLTLNELASLTGVPLDTASRYLEQLTEFGYVEQVSGRYRLGAGVLPLCHAAANCNPIRQAAMRTLWALSDETALNANLGVPWRGRVMYLGRAESQPWRTFRCNIGRLAPLHCTAMGKVLLAFSQAVDPPGELTRYTPRTITAQRKLMEEIARIAEVGYATDDSEWIEGIRCIAAPVRGPGGKVVAAISVSGPSARVDLECEDLVRAVLRAAYEVQSQLGLTA